MKVTGPGGDRAAGAITALLADAPKPDDHPGVREYIRRACEVHLAILLLHPGTKEPCDMRTGQKRAADDRAAREAARQAGRRNWERVRSPSGLALATSDIATLDKFLDRYITIHGDGTERRAVEVNLAVETGRSRLVIVDCDTAGQLEAFLADAGLPADTEPTVRSPGARDPITGEWLHRDGGHFYYTVPEDVELPTELGAITLGATGYAVLWRGRYVLIPPSVRAEGAYTSTGAAYPLTDHLREQITERAAARADRAQRARTVASNGHLDRNPLAKAITAWGQTITLGEMLEPIGWTLIGRPDTCGCDIWRAPGDHANDKSATAHEYGCGFYTNSIEPPLRVWTTNPGEPLQDLVDAKGGTLTRFDVFTAIHYGGDMSKATEDLMKTEHAPDPSVEFSLNGEIRGDEDIDDDDDGDDADETARPTLTLPQEFWTRHPRLQRFHDMCLSKTAPPDATLGADLARLSAHMPPSVRIYTGARFPLPLNLNVIATTVTGKGKTTASRASKALIMFMPDWTGDPMESPVRTAIDDVEFPKTAKLKTGEGLVEAYYGKVLKVVGTNANGTPIRKMVREVVRSNVFAENDEGATVVKQINDPKQTLDDTMREMFSGMLAGASLADPDRTRLLAQGQYSLGTLTGTQQSVVGELVIRANIEKGTVQRFLLLWARPGAYVDEALLASVAHLAGDEPLKVNVPNRCLRLCDTLRERIVRENTAEFLAGDDEDDDTDEDSLVGLDSQRLAMISRVAGLVQVFLGDGEIDELGYLVVGEPAWEAAEEMFDVCLAIATDAVARRRNRNARATKTSHARARVEKIADRDAITDLDARAKAKLIGALAGQGRVKWSGRDGLRNRQFNGDKKAAAQLELMIKSGQVRRTKEGQADKTRTYVEVLW